MHAVATVTPFYSRYLYCSVARPSLLVKPKLGIRDSVPFCVKWGRASATARSWADNIEAAKQRNSGSPAIRGNFAQELRIIGNFLNLILMMLL